MMRGFDFPEDLPKDIEELRLYKGLTASTEYFDAMYDRLKSMLLSKSHRPVSAASEQKMYSMRLTVLSPVETTVSINDEESIVMIIDPNSGFDYQSQDIQVPSGFDLLPHRQQLQTGKSSAHNPSDHRHVRPESSARSHRRSD